MNGEFVTWGILGTYAGAVSITAIITQFLKRLSFMKKVDSQLLSYVIALIILEASTIFMRGFSWDVAAIGLVNAFVVALASNGVYDVMANGVKKAVPAVAAPSANTETGGEENA